MMAHAIVCVAWVSIAVPAALHAQSGSGDADAWRDDGAAYRQYVPASRERVWADQPRVMDGWRDASSATTVPAGDRRATRPPTTIYFDVPDDPLPRPTGQSAWTPHGTTGPAMPPTRKQPAPPAMRRAPADYGVPPPDSADAGRIPAREQPFAAPAPLTRPTRPARVTPQWQESPQRPARAAPPARPAIRPQIYTPGPVMPRRATAEQQGGSGMVSASPQPGESRRPPPAQPTRPAASQPRAIAPRESVGRLPASAMPAWQPASAQRPSQPAMSAGQRTADVSSLAPPTRAGRNTLGTGDGIRVTVFGQEDLTTETVVGEDGSITLPLVNRVRVGGLSPQEAGDRIAAAYENGDFLKNPQVSVTIEALRSRQVSVLGEVAEPGRFPLESQMSLLDALALAGGISPEGSEQILLLRPAGNQTLRYTVDVSDVLAGRSADGVQLGAGDTVFVPEAPKFYIYGEVQRPNAYPLREAVTVMQAISLGGGLTDRGSDKRIDIRRPTDEGGTRTLSADLEDPVQPGDVIYVRERLF